MEKEAEKPVMQASSGVSTGWVVTVAVLVGIAFGGAGYFLGNLYPLATLRDTPPPPSTQQPSGTNNGTPDKADSMSGKDEMEKPEAAPAAPSPQEIQLSETAVVTAYQKNFTFDYPTGWNVVEDHTGFSSTVTVTAPNGALVRIRQADIGPPRCVFPDEADFGSGGPFMVDYPDYDEFLGAVGTFRRGAFSLATEAYSVCHRGLTVDTFNAYSHVGLVDYEVPANATAQDVEALDNIVATLTEI